MSPSTPESTEASAAVLFVADGVTYEYVRELGRRGSGELLLARRRLPAAGISSLVSVKRMASPGGSSERRRLLEEVKLSLRLAHPSISRLLHVVSWQEEPYGVWEYVEGCSLGTATALAGLRQRRLSESFAAHVGMELADALHHAHTLTSDTGRGLALVHRDVSPRNIRLGRQGEVKLTDFGAARSRLPGRPRTRGSVIRGDCAYAAPEALLGRNVDPRADVFSLGLVLLEVLTGIHLYDDAHAPPEHSSPPRRGRAPRCEEPSFLSSDALAERAARLAPESVARAAQALSAPMRQVLQRALQPHPGARFASAAHLRDALRALSATRGSGYGRLELLDELRGLVIEAAPHREEMELSSAEAVFGGAFRLQA
jgi:serine/threonine protein kinase